MCAVTVQFCRFVEKYEFNSVKIIDIALVLMYMYRLINLCINTYAKGSNLLFLPLILVLLKKYTTNCNIDIFYVIHIKYNAMMAEKKVTHGRATIFKIVRNVCFTEKVFAIIGEMGSMLVLFVSTICRDLNTYSLTIYLVSINTF